jgi:hypothetical protein
VQTVRIRRRYGRGTFCLLLLLLHALPAVAVQRGASIVILPFEDHSYFRGVWNIRQDIPRQLGDLLHGTGDFVVCPVDTAAALPTTGKTATMTDDQARRIGQAAGADLVLTGDILNFSIRRISVGNPFVAGYSSYAALVEIDTRLLRTLPGAQEGVAIQGKAEATSNDLGLMLLGKPTETEAVHTRLNTVAFGDEQFATTIIGKVTFEALQQIVDELTGKVSDLSGLIQQDPRVLSMTGEEGFVNLGLEDKIEAGYRFVVYSRQDTQRIGVVQIEQILAPHLARIKTLEGGGSIHEGDLLRPPQSP